MKFSLSKIVHAIVLAATLVILPTQVSAANIALICKGKNFGKRFSTSEHTFTVMVDKGTGQMFGFAAYVMPGCMNDSESFVSKITSNVSDSAFQMNCTTERIASSFATLNRYTLILDVTTVWSDSGDTSKGIYNCRIAPKKAI